MPPIELTLDQLRRLRLRAQRLLNPTPAAPNQVVRELCAVQAQDPAAAALAIGVRAENLTLTSVEQARAGELSLVRTWGPRGTLHLLASEDVGWMLALLGPVFIAGDRARRVELGLDEAACARGVQLIQDILARQAPMPRSLLAARLAERGLPLAGQAFPHLVAYAAWEGVLCLGPEQGREASYVLLREWLPGVPSPLSRPEALARLALRYLEAYGPAGLADLARWLGLPSKEAQAAWQAVAQDTLDVRFQGETLRLLRSQAGWLDERDAAPLKPHLLPAFEPLLLGYRRRDWLLDPRYASRVNAGGGIIRPVLLEDGRITGVWRAPLLRGSLEVQISRFDSQVPVSPDELETCIQNLSRFLNQTMTWKIL